MKFNWRMFWGIWSVAAYISVDVHHIGDGWLWTLLATWLLAAGAWLIVTGWPTTTVNINMVNSVNKTEDDTQRMKRIRETYGV